MNTNKSKKKVPPCVVVHTGRRDDYHGVVALHNGGNLKRFATDVILPYSIAKIARKYSGINFELRSIPEVPYSRTAMSWTSAACSLASMLSRSWYRRLIPLKDSSVSLLAAKLAVKHEAALLAYSYYAGAGFAKYGDRIPQKFIFQVHPAGRFLRKLFLEEMEKLPRYSESLQSEEEIAFQNQFQLDNEAAAQMSNGFICASSFTKQSLRDQGISSPISVVPYGVDTERIDSSRNREKRFKKFTIAFVGQVNQRKGFGYLLDSVKQFGKHIQIKVFSRSSIPEIFSQAMPELNIDHCQGLSNSELNEELKKCDLFVLPSIAEGFGLVILEAMAASLPVLVTDNTGGPDIITNGKEGFIVPAGNSNALTEAIETVIDKRDELFEMGRLARKTAEKQTWTKYRTEFNAAYESLFRRDCS